jgi:hypothetical protein
MENSQDPAYDRKTQGHEEIQGPQYESVDENELNGINHRSLKPLSQLFNRDESFIFDKSDMSLYFLRPF